MVYKNSKGEVCLNKAERKERGFYTSGGEAKFCEVAKLAGVGVDRVGVDDSSNRYVDLEGPARMWAPDYYMQCGAYVECQQVQSADHVKWKKEKDAVADLFYHYNSDGK